MGLQTANAFPLISWHIKHEPNANNNNNNADLCSGFHEREKQSESDWAERSKPKLKLERRLTTAIVLRERCVSFVRLFVRQV